MNMTNAEFQAIEKALRLLPDGEGLKRLDKDTQEVIINADTAMLNILNKKKKTNARIAQYIAEKRKTDKNYAR